MKGRIPYARRLAIAGAGLGLLAFSPAAFAGNLSRSGSVVSYDAGGENNSVTISQSATSVTVSDPRGVTPKTGCTQGANDNTAFCNLSSLSRIDIDVSGGNDFVQAPGVTARMNIWGQGGDDSLNGGSGFDMIDGGIGDDVVHGNGGDDTIYGRAGDDTLFGDDGDDYLDGGTGNDHINGGAGNDHEVGYLADDVLHGNDGNDLLEAGAGDDTLLGDRGIDNYLGDAGLDTINSVDNTNEQVDCGGGLFDIATVNDGDVILFASCENFTFLPKTA
jgi:Ca2+-binding RTX toxin-like protein